MNIWQVEVLGVSLPWTGIFSNNSIGADFIKLLQENSAKIAKLHRSSDVKDSTNPFIDNPTAHASSQSFVQPSLANNVFDFLSGDYAIPNQLDNSNISRSTELSSGELFDFLDSSAADSHFSASSEVPSELHNESAEESNSIQLYLNIFRSFPEPNKVTTCYFPFLPI